MIKSLKVIDTDHFGPMKAAFPLGHELDTDSNLVLVVGPNGSGKTGFLRALYSSIGFEDYFKTNGISQWWQWYMLDKLDNAFFKSDFQGVEEKNFHCGIWERLPTEDGYYGHIDFSEAVNALNSGSVNDDLRHAFSYIKYNIGQDASVVSSGNGWTIKDGKNTYELESCGDAPKRQLNIKATLTGWMKYPHRDTILELLSQDSRFDIDMKRDYCVHHVRQPGEFYGMRVGADIPIGLISKAAFGQVKKAKKLLSKPTDVNIWGFVKPDIEGEKAFAWMSRPSTAIRRDAHTGDEVGYGNFLVRYAQDIAEPRSAGTGQMRHIEDGLDYIKRFFEKREIVHLPVKNAPVMWLYETKTESVPDDAQLVALMDEPTEFLDYRNIYKARDMLLKTLEKYPRLQMFVATNDPVLIEKTPGCRYIDLYKQPAESAARISVMQA